MISPATHLKQEFRLKVPSMQENLVEVEKMSYSSWNPEKHGEAMHEIMNTFDAEGWRMQDILMMLEYIKIGEVYMSSELLPTIRVEEKSEEFTAMMGEIVEVIRKYELNHTDILAVFEMVKAYHITFFVEDILTIERSQSR